MQVLDGYPGIKAFIETMEARTLHPKPSTLNPQPSTLNPKPETLNPKP